MRDESDSAKLQRRNRELSILNAIAEALNREVDLAQSLQTALARVAELLGLHTGWIWLLNEETGAFYLAASQHLPPALTRAPQRMEGSCYCLDTFRDGDLSGAANVNVVTCSRLKGLVDGTDGLRYHASIPLYAHSRKLGVLNVASSDWRELSPNDLRLLYTVGDLLSMAIERARLFEQSIELGMVQERNRLAREIHDTLAQGLTAIALQLETADALIEGAAEPMRVRRAVTQALSLTRANLEEVRRSVLDLRAAPLEGRSLVEALKAMVEEMASQAGIQATVMVAGANRPLPLRVEAGLYRIAQEAVTNVLRHAWASHLQVRLELTPDEVSLTVQDDGRGFDEESVSPDRYGLIGLSERARLLGGALELVTDRGHGTFIRVVVPH